MSAGFEGKAFLVTGASSGIGRAVAVGLSRRGAKVALSGRDQEALAATLAQMEGAGHLSLRADLCDIEGVEGLVDKVLAWREPLDGVAYCAGIAGRARLRDTGPRMLLERMTVNCFAFVELLRQIVRRKKKTQPLSVVAISSLAALGHDRYLSAYAASKAALEAAAKSLAVELLPRHVRINLVRCAFVDTPMATGGDALGDFEAQLKESGYQPLGLIPPAVVADAVARLLGPEGAWSTGQVTTINAGVAG
ncbi:SDR family oxidoreductase [Desulfovibrio sp.]|uniref:SDR family NAD(P)-dependent oxidoreductase n=1 Tax=Desulfovibrio sp. TaxID=885 RepID=UPI0023C7470F|nr:SDR family oxidoreductase [Desulfovibrio sp.]MDE7241031.1 SDR family oxidoreductase [Desulfovibrio sp.]